MADRQFVNAVSTTLSSGMTNVQTTMTVASATGFPSTFPFDVHIEADDPPGTGTDEILSVTSLSSGTTYNVTRASEAYAGSSSASAHSSGAVVRLVVTAAALAALALPSGGTQRQVFGNSATSAPAWIDQWFNVKAYGAVGDDTTDDTTAIQAAITAAEPTGGTIYLPPGSYKITAELVVNNGTTPSGMVRFLGAGGGDSPASVIRQATANTNGIRSGANEYDTWFEHLLIKGPGGGSSGSGLYGNNRNIHTLDVRVEGFYYGLRIGPQSYYSRHFGTMAYNNAGAGFWVEAGANNASFIVCRSTTNGAQGLRIDGAQNVRVVGGAYENNTGYGISIDTNGGQTTDGTSIIAAYFENNGSASIYLGATAACRSTLIEGCFFTSPQTGYFIDAERATYLTIAGCGFLGTPTSGDIRLQASTDHVLLENNRPSGVGNSLGGSSHYTLDPASPPMTDPTSAEGDMIYRASGVPARLAVGTATQLIHGGTDPAYSAVVPADMDVSADITTANVTSGHHGLAPKLSGVATQYLDGSGGWSVPPGTGGGSGTLLIDDAHSTPLVFADILQNESGSDFLYTG